MTEPVEIRALIVDDNPGDARLVQIILEKEKGYRIHSERAARVAAAVERVSQGDIDVVLLDLGLPDSQGTEGVRKIRAAAPRVAIVVLSGTDNPDTSRGATTAGAQEYLVKGIFPPGFLGRTLRLAVVIRAVETDLGDERAISPEVLDELGAVRLGAAILAPHGISQSNRAFSELTGFTPARGDPRPPPWLTQIIGAVPPTEPSASEVLRNAPAAPVDVGMLTLEGPTGPGPPLEYLIRRFPRGLVPRTLFLVRPFEENRRATHRLAPRPEETGTGASLTTLDPETWRNLRELAGTDTTFLPKLVAAFGTEGRRLVGNLQSAVDEADSPRIARLAHTLKSTCAQVGALELSRKCSSLESQSESANIPLMRPMILEIAREFALVADALGKQFPARP